MSVKLGIDFGTCYSSAALLLEGIPSPVPVPLTSGYSLPSSVFISEDGSVLVGQAAENVRQKSPHRYRREFKRDLGSPDPYTFGNSFMLPEDLVAEVLKKLKSESEKIAQGRGQQCLNEAIIAVPATYTLYKRNLMRKAGEKAGFTQVELLEEPMAAAIYYSRYARINDDDIILVSDLGGGTFDATLMQKQGKTYQFLGVPRQVVHFGGIDFDRSIYDYLKQNCSRKLKEYLESKNAWLAKATVFDMCQQLKHQLTEEAAATIYIPIGLEEVEAFSLSRKSFEEMIEPLILETIDCCEQLVSSAGINWEQIKQVLLVGGSSRIPYISRILELRLEHTVLLVDKPDLAVSLGAAMFQCLDSVLSSNSNTRLATWESQTASDIQSCFDNESITEKATQRTPTSDKDNSHNPTSLESEIQRLFDGFSESN